MEALMPRYEYACQECGHRFETWQGIREEPLKTCPNCGGPIRRVVQPVGIVFKGSGFYKTDSRSSSEAPAAAGERKDGAATPAGDAKTQTPAATSPNGSSAPTSNSTAPSTGASSNTSAGSANTPSSKSNAPSGKSGTPPA
jgi:putative FmdB family regulatory protein